ncbi:MAG: hypothetical protein QOH05_2332 [Acetobacteraceae bacterium]|jgi:hypothetical protein|nr:hypothetical protein [Acetobacteraceae bacterium]
MVTIGTLHANVRRVSVTSAAALTRVVTIFLAAFLVIGLTACAGSDNGSQQPHRGQAGPYIGGGAGIGF